MDIFTVYFEILRSELNGTELSSAVKNFILIENNLEKIYKLSNSQDTAHLVGSCLLKNNLLENNLELKSKFSKKLKLAVLRVEQFNYEIESIKKVLEENKIEFIFLKGSAIRKGYPEAWMRTSCDIDLLIKENSLESARACLCENLGYVYEDRDPHEITLKSPSNVTVELHYELLESRLPKAMGILSNAWYYVKDKDGNSYEKEFTFEMFYFYHIAHMAKHFVVGGCGVKPFIDLWVLKNNINCDLSLADEMLKKGDILTFAKKSEELAEVWFSNKESNPTLDKMQKFLLSGGTYGSIENGVKIKQTKQKGKIRFIFSRLFAPMSVLSNQYPVLKKCPILMPIFQVVRWFRMLFEGRLKKSISEVSASNKLTKQEITETANFLEEIGL